MSHAIVPLAALALLIGSYVGLFILFAPGDFYVATVDTGFKNREIRIG